MEIKFRAPHAIDAMLPPNSLVDFRAGESYAGQYIPNIAYHVLQSSYSFTITGLAVGNGCWGGTQSSVQCNGPHAEKNDIDSSRLCGNQPLCRVHPIILH